MKRLLYSIAVIGILYLCAACKHSHAHEHEHQMAHEHGEACTGHEVEDIHNEDIIELPESQAAAAGVVVEEVQPSIFYNCIKTSGKIMAAQGDEVTIVATANGIVSLKNNTSEGRSVNKGNTLVALSSKQLADGDPVQKAQIAYHTAKREYERMKPLAESRIVSEKEFNRVTESYEMARLSYEAIAKRETVGGQAIVAPISGYVKNVYVNEGDYVTVGQPLLQLTQNQRLVLRAEVSERYYAQLSQITSARFQTPYNDIIYSLSELNGKLLSVGKSAGSGSYHIPVTFEFDNKGEIVPGSFVEVYLLSSPIHETISLPRSAITEEQGLHFAYTCLGEGHYRKQQIMLGADNGERVQVVSGLNAREKVVTKGALRVKLASASGAIPGHTHEH